MTEPHPVATAAADDVVAAVLAVHPKRHLLDAYGQRTPYCGECRQAWPCATVTALTPFIPQVQKEEPF